MKTKNAKKELTQKRRLSDTLDDNACGQVLKGASICLTGFPTERKKEMMKSVQKLGGSYTRELLTRSTTHLIAGRTEGAKFEEAKKCNEIAIVAPKWLEICELENRMVPISNYCLVKRRKTVISMASQENISSIQDSLQNACNDLLIPGKVPPNNLFSSCCFMFIGFTEKDSDRILSENEKDEAMSIKQSLSGLIRRSMGTIFWNVNVNITHVIVSDRCDKKTRNDVRNFCRYHGKNPFAISPEWIIGCLSNKHKLDEQKFPPNTRPAKSSVSSNSTPSLRKGIFDGAFFLITESSQQISPHEVTFSKDEAERIIKFHGGQILSQKNIHTSIKDSSSMSKSSCDHICYVLNLSGSFNFEKSIEIHPCVRRMSQNKSYRLLPASVMWLYACDAHKSHISPDKLPFIFKPQSWSLRKIHDANLKVTGTGFTSIERLGLRHVLSAIGVSYTENMGNKNTHLICKDATIRGAKYQKAKEWRLYVVKIEWVYHIMQNGYNLDCEKEFLVCKREILLQGSTTSIFSANDRKRTLHK